jgi:hypothetical protein
VRHLYGIALASITTMALFFGGAWAYERLLSLSALSGTTSALPAAGGSLLSNTNVLYALAALVVTGLLIGIGVAAPWISPLASGLPGLLLIGWTGIYLTSVSHATELIPLRSHAFGAGWEALLYSGTLGVLGLAMIIPMFVPSRWRKRRDERDEAETAEVDDFLADLTRNAKTGELARAVTGGTPVTSIITPVTRPRGGEAPLPSTRNTRTRPSD